MKNIGIAKVAMLIVLLLITASVQAAGVNNIGLSPVGANGISGMATTIVGDIAGANPYHNVEVNINVAQTPAKDMVYQAWLIDSKDNYKLSLGAFSGNRLNLRERMVAALSTMPYDSIAISIESAQSTSVQPTTIIAQGSLPGTSVAASDFQTLAVLPQDEAFQRQAITARFNMTGDQYSSLRMMGWGPADIAAVGNVAYKCKKSPSEVASMLSQGQSWEQIAAGSNTTTAMLFEPYPVVAVAGSQQQYGVPVVSPTLTYGKYYNGRPVITKDDWRQFSKSGFSWQSVAMAANIAAQTGERPEQILRELTVQGKTWIQLTDERNLDYDTVKDTSGWPFSKTESSKSNTSGY